MNKQYINRSFLLLLIFLLQFSLYAQNVHNKKGEHWKISGEREITFDIDNKANLPYTDNIEMAGKRVAGIVKYSIDKERKLSLDREIFFPQLHEFKTSEDTWYHDYRAYLKGEYTDELLPKLYIKNEQFVPGAVKTISINGVLSIVHHPSKNGLMLSRSLFPSMDERLFVEMWTIKNSTDTTMKIRAGNTSLKFNDYGAKGKYSRHIYTDAPEHLTLKPSEEATFSLMIKAKIEGEVFPEEAVNETLASRKAFISSMAGSLILDTPNPVLNTLFEFSKIRASESIFESELGLIHSPGGGRYYVGIWANDQAEYINPFFPYLGYEAGNISAMNTFKAFAKETNSDYKNIRYAFEIEGLVKPFLKDRGDAAMIAFGATHYAMAMGDKQIAEELWPLISWCLEYCNRKLNDEGVVMSESDEMEGRIETGNSNLSTSSLYYGALNHAQDLARALNKTKALQNTYKEQAKRLKVAIEHYFGAHVEGLDTYRYYKGHKYLRHWICLPLVVGINERQAGTVEALFDRLWTDNGVHVEKHSDNEAITKVFWDRGTLYALRGTFASGEIKKSLEKLEQFSKKRLLGNRVPYVVEAYPEGNMAHLSAESGLYCRVFTEGIFGITPTGLKSFTCVPRLPERWSYMYLNRIKAFGEDFSIKVNSAGKKIRVTVVKSNGTIVYSKKIAKGSSIHVTF